MEQDKPISGEKRILAENNEEGVSVDNNIANALMVMPKSVAVAINKVMELITPLKKENSNTFDKYLFTSIDDFLASMNPILAKSGLIIVQNETSYRYDEVTTKAGKKRMMDMSFDFYVFSKEGDGYGPIKRSVSVLASGAQAFGSAQSYSLKQFQRSLFQIATGEQDDPDNKQTIDIGTTSEIDVKKTAETIRRQIKAASNKGKLQDVSKKFGLEMQLIKKQSEVAYQFLMDEIDAKDKGFANKALNEDVQKQQEEDMEPPK